MPSTRPSGLAWRVLALILVAVGVTAFAARRDPTLLDHPAFGVVVPLALLLGFIGIYLRDRPRDHEDIDEDEHRRRFGMTVIKFGCLLVVTAFAAAILMEMVLRWWIQRA